LKTARQIQDRPLMYHVRGTPDFPCKRNIAGDYHWSYYNEEE